MQCKHWDEPRIRRGAENPGFPKVPSKTWTEGLGAADKTLRQTFPTPTGSGFPSGTIYPIGWGRPPTPHLLGSVSPRPSALGE